MTIIPSDTWVDGIIVRPDGCWGHEKRLQSNGYLKSSFGGLHRWAHRVVYEWLRGPIPTGLCIDHLCRNRFCLNPEHMETVTAQENNRRGESVFARNARKTHCPRGHLLDGVVTLKDGSRAPWRRCLTCHRDRERKRYRARKKIRADG